MTPSPPSGTPGAPSRAALAGPGVPSSGVRAMFAGIAGRYDLGNRVLSLGMDRRWRRAASAFARAKPGHPVLDVCSGTGELAFSLAARGARVVGIDFCPEMVVRAAAKARRRGVAAPFAVADALALPFRPAAFAAATIAFGLRNLADPAAGLREMRRVLRPGGSAVVLEFVRPRPGFLAACYGFYARTVLPRVGGWITGRRDAYEYLPRTVYAFGTAEDLRGALAEAGFGAVEARLLSGGTVACVRGVKPGDSGV